MKLYKYKYSFLIIEILLGLFLLVIFTSTAIITPKYLTLPMIDKAISLELNHLADKYYFDFLNNLSTASLPLKKEKNSFLNTSSNDIKIFSSYTYKVSCQTIVILKEIKHINERKIYLYDYILEFTYKINNSNIEKKNLYSFVCKS